MFKSFRESASGVKLGLSYQENNWSSIFFIDCPGVRELAFKLTKEWR